MCRDLRLKYVYLVLFSTADVGAFVCLTLLLPNLNANIVFVRAALLWCGTLYTVNVLAVIERMRRVLRLKYVYLVLFIPTDVGAFVCLTLLLPNLNANIVFVCSLSVVQQVLLKTKKESTQTRSGCAVLIIMLVWLRCTVLVVLCWLRCAVCRVC